MNAANVLGIRKTPSQRRPARHRLYFRSAFGVGRISISGSGFEIVVVGGRLRPAAADAAESAADVAVDEAERGRHESAEVGDGEQCQGDAENGVDDRHHLTPRRLRCYVPVTCSAKHWQAVMTRGVIITASCYDATIGLTIVKRYR